MGLSNRILYRDVVLRAPKHEPAETRDVAVSHPRANPGGRPEKYAYLEAFDDVEARLLRDRPSRTGAELVNWMLSNSQSSHARREIRQRRGRKMASGAVGEDNDEVTEVVKTVALDPASGSDVVAWV